MSLRLESVQSQREYDQAAGIIARSFSYADMEKVHNLWALDPDYSIENIFRLVDSNNRNLGSIRLVPRSLKMSDRVVKCVFLANICIEPVHRGEGYSIELVEQALEKARSMGFELAVLSSRRALDGYYQKFGFWGVSADSEIRVLVRDIRLSDSVAAYPMSEDSLVVANNLYEKNYVDCAGHVLRNPNYWKYLIAKCSESNLSIFWVESHGEKIGYAIVSPQKIIEIAISEVANFHPVLSAIVKLVDCTDGYVKMSIPQDHFAAGALTGVDVVYQQRSCPYGGLMICSLEEAVDFGFDQLLAKYQILGVPANSQGHTQFKVFNVGEIDQV